jgi:hypothetical protein
MLQGFNFFQHAAVALQLSVRLTNLAASWKLKPLLLFGA